MDLAYYIEGSTSNERLAALKRQSTRNSWGDQDRHTDGAVVKESFLLWNHGPSSMGLDAQ
jgi:hypothetical protein